MLNRDTISKDILTQILSKLNYPIIISDNKGNFLFLNAKAADILKLPEKSSNKNEWSKFFIVKNIKNEIMPLENYTIMKALSSEDVNGDKIILSNIVDQTQTYITVDSFPLYDEDKKQVGAVVAMNDISDEMRLKNILHEVSEKLDRIKEHLEATLYPKYIL